MIEQWHAGRSAVVLGIRIAIQSCKVEIAEGYCGKCLATIVGKFGLRSVHLAVVDCLDDVEGIAHYVVRTAPQSAVVGHRCRVIEEVEGVALTSSRPRCGLHAVALDVAIEEHRQIVVVDRRHERVQSVDGVLHVRQRCYGLLGCYLVRR